MLIQWTLFVTLRYFRDFRGRRYRLWTFSNNSVSVSVRSVITMLAKAADIFKCIPILTPTWPKLVSKGNMLGGICCFRQHLYDECMEYRNRSTVVTVSTVLSINQAQIGCTFFCFPPLNLQVLLFRALHCVHQNWRFSIEFLHANVHLNSV